MDVCPKCYGKPDDDERCRKCQWRESCAVFASLPPPEPRPIPGRVGYEAAGGAADIADSGASTDAELLDGPLFTMDDMSVLVNLFLSLDDYELQILQHVVHGRYCSLSELARVFGVTKQAMHRKLADACFRHPQVASLLDAHLRRCRRVLQCRKARPNQRVRRDERQMEFKF